MKAIVIPQYGGPEVLTVREVPSPEPAAGGILVRTQAVGVNFADIMSAAGGYPGTPPPPRANAGGAPRRKSVSTGKLHSLQALTHWQMGSSHGAMASTRSSHYWTKRRHQEGSLRLPWPAWRQLDTVALSAREWKLVCAAYGLMLARNLRTFTSARIPSPLPAADPPPMRSDLS